MAVSIEKIVRKPKEIKSDVAEVQLIKLKTGKQENYRNEAQCKRNNFKKKN